MVRGLLPAAVAATVALLAPGPLPAAEPPEAAGHVVVLAGGAGDPGAVAAEHAAAFGFGVDHLYRAALSGYAADLTPADVSRLRADPRVVAVEPDRPVALTAAVVPAGVDRVDADLSVTAAIDDADEPRVDADVAVLDTGIDTDHPDLNVAGGHNCAGDKGYDDRLGHGTHIAGIIGALDDGKGVVGVAPGVRLWAVRVLDHDGRGTTKELLCGIDWVTGTRTDDDRSNDIEVANLSLGGQGGDDRKCGRVDGDLLHQAICRSVESGVTYVVAAGNDSADSAGYAPAAFREVITVSALADSDGRPGGLGGAPSCRGDRDDTLANFSNYGDDVDLIAPGVCILSTVPLDATAFDGPQRGYGLLTGTSFAAPHVAGAAALWVSGHSGADPAEVRRALIDAGSDDWDDSEDPDGTQEPLVNVERF